MTADILLINLAGVLAAAAPIIFGVIGETISERSGVSNLSMNGMILLSAMGSFAVALATKNAAAGFLAGAAIGALVSLVIAFASITLRLSEVAVGFVLALLCRDLSYFLGSPIMGEVGPRLNVHPVPLLKDIPVLGPLMFRQDFMTYASYAIVALVWLYMFRTKAGLTLRGIGEDPKAAYVRGANVNRLRYLYAAVGGAIAGLAGPIYSLSVKAGWKGTISGLDGIGWIVLSITIFGGWRPFRAMFGCYLFALLQWLGLALQPALPGIPAQVLQVAPFPLMILTLLLVNVGNSEWVERMLLRLGDKNRKRAERVIRALNARPPRALGVPFEKE